MLIEVIFSLCVKIFLLTALGFVLRKKGVINDDFQNRLSIILVEIIIPLSILAAAGGPKGQGFALNLLLTGGITLAYYGASIFLMVALSRALPLEKNNRQQFVNLCVFANVGYIGFPIIQALYGSEGMLYAVVCNLIFQLIVFTYGEKSMGGGEIGWKRFFLRTAIIAPVLGILLYLSPFSLPAPLLDTFNLLSQMSAPFSLFIIGASLATIPFSSVWKSGCAWLVSAIRQVAFPLIMALLLRLLGFSGIVAATSVVLYSLPSATINVIFAQKYSGDMPFATRAVSQGVILMLFTLPLAALLCSYLFGV